jgi:release factor glutamine methyltransferase
MSQTWTIRSVLQWTQSYFKEKTLDTPRLDAELLIGDALKVDRVRLYMDLDRPLTDAELADIRERVRRRGKHEPVAYITGKRGFWKLDLAVDARVLIPRPDTERLVELAVEVLQGREAPRVVDVGTGSGAIALSIAQERPDAAVLAIDVSPDALAAAEANAVTAGLTNVTFARGDVLGPAQNFRPDVILSNPPYIPSRECETLMPDVRQFEPRLALDGGADGLVIIRKLVTQAGALLPVGGALLFEIGHDQGEAAAALVQADGRFAEVAVVKDYGGKDRVVRAARV